MHQMECVMHQMEYLMHQMECIRREYFMHQSIRQWLACIVINRLSFTQRGRERVRGCQGLLGGGASVARYIALLR